METLNRLNRKLPLWTLGFRPFFLLASIFALAIIPIWVGVFTGIFRPIGYFEPILWHAHEMIYGYITAVIAGFVLTASQNWTGRRGVHGLQLQVLACVWIAGRLVMSVSSRSSLAGAAIDLSFYPVLAGMLIPYFKPADIKIERVFFVYFALFFAGNLMMHLQALGWGHDGLRGALLGLNTTILVIVFIGGRVIPFFTESARARSQPISRRWVEILAHVSTWLFVATQFFSAISSLAAIIAFSAAVIHFFRLLGWQARRVSRVPVIWVLHLAYLWIILGFILFGCVSLDVLPWGPAVHAFAIGTLGAMTYGMMSRVALGHTGRRILPARAIVVGYVLLNLAAAIRVLGPILSMPRLALWVRISGFFWLVAFVLFCWVYIPILLAPRADQPGLALTSQTT